MIVLALKYAFLSFFIVPLSFFFSSLTLFQDKLQTMVSYTTSPSLLRLLGLVAVTSNVWTGVRAQDDGGRDRHFKSVIFVSEC